MSHLFVGSGNSLQEIQSVELDEESLLDMAMRIKMQPHFMGEPLVVIAETQDFPHQITKDGYILAALDMSGQVVIIDLKLGRSRSAEPVKSLRYAAFIGQLSSEELGKIARSYAARPGNLSTLRMWQEANVEMNDESVELSSLLATAFHRDADDYADSINREQRIIIAAESFGHNMAEVITWLAESGVKLKGVQYRKFMIGGQEIYQAQQVVPETSGGEISGSSSSAHIEVEEPWKIRGKTYYMERLTPNMGNKLQELLTLMKPSTFNTSWAQKYYFMVRGKRRNLRVRAYQRNRLDIGFLDVGMDVVNAFLKEYHLESYEAVKVGGYDKSPFVSITSDTELDDRWRCALSDWLDGYDAGFSAPLVTSDKPVIQ